MSDRWTRFLVTSCCWLFFLGTPHANRAIGQEAIPPPAKPQLAERIEFQFREGISKQPTLRLFGANVGMMAFIQPGGLCFNLPNGRGNPGDVGVDARLRLRGDFEITLEYELLALPNPAPKLGAGVSLQVFLDTPDAFRARLGRQRKMETAVFGANYIIAGADGKEKFQGLTAPPANDKKSKGHLRLVRTGNLLSYQVEEGGLGFRTIAIKKDVDRADVIAVQAIAFTGWQAVALEVRFPRLELRATEIPDKGDVVVAPAAVAIEQNAPAVPALATQNDTGGGLIGGLVIGLGGVFSLIMVAGLVYLLRNRGAAAVVPSRPQPSAGATPFVRFSCPDCGKNLKVKAESAGKKLKCPECGSIPPVPRADAI